MGSGNTKKANSSSLKNDVRPILKDLQGSLKEVTDLCRTRRDGNWHTLTAKDIKQIPTSELEDRVSKVNASLKRAEKALYQCNILFSKVTSWDPEMIHYKDEYTFLKDNKAPDCFQVAQTLFKLPSDFEVAHNILDSHSHGLSRADSRATLLEKKFRKKMIDKNIPRYAPHLEDEEEDDCPVVAKQ